MSSSNEAHGNVPYRWKDTMTEINGKLISLTLARLNDDIPKAGLKPPLPLHCLVNSAHNKSSTRYASQYSMWSLNTSFLER